MNLRHENQSISGVIESVLILLSARHEILGCKAGVLLLHLASHLLGVCHTLILTTILIVEYHFVLLLDLLVLLDGHGFNFTLGQWVALSLHDLVLLEPDTLQVDLVLLDELDLLIALIWIILFLSKFVDSLSNLLLVVLSGNHRHVKVLNCLGRVKR